MTPRFFNFGAGPKPTGTRRPPAARASSFGIVWSLRWHPYLVLSSGAVVCCSGAATPSGEVLLVWIATEEYDTTIEAEARLRPTRFAGKCRKKQAGIQAVYPRAHTCFNRIDVPLYRTKEELVASFEFVLELGDQTFTMD